MRAHIDDLRVLQDLVETLHGDSSCSWSECARRLNIDDGTLSNTCKRLGTEFKRRVIDRSGDHPAVTAEGLELYQLAKEFLAKATGTRAAEFLNIQVADSIAAEILPGALREFLADHRGEVVLRLRQLNYQTIRNDVMNGRVAFGVGWRFLAEQSSLIVPFKPGFDLALVAPPDHRFAREGKTTLEPEDLQTETVFTLQADLRTPSINGLLQTIPAENRVECRNYHAVLTHAREGLGVGLVPGWRWTLERLRQEKAIYYFMLPRQYRQHNVAFLPNGGVESLGGHALALYRAIENNIKRLSAG